MTLTLVTRTNASSDPCFETGDSEDTLWEKMSTFVGQVYGITSMLYGFTHSKYTVTRAGIMKSIYMRHDFPDDFLATYGGTYTLEDSVAAQLILEGHSHLLWSDFPSMNLNDIQRARIAKDMACGMGTGISFGFRFGANSGFSGLCWASRDRCPKEFKELMRARRSEVDRVGAAFDAHMRPAMLANRIQLTRREKEVLSLSAGGMTGKQIALHLNLSLKTVNNTLDRARRSIGAVSTMEAVAKALVYELIV